VPDQPFAHFNRAGGREVDEHAECFALFGLAVLPVRDAIAVRDFHPRGDLAVGGGEFFNGGFLQFEEGFRVVEVARLALREKIGGDRPGVLLQREDGQRHSGAIIEESLPDVFGVDIEHAFFDAPNHFALRFILNKAVARMPFDLRD